MGFFGLLSSSNVFAHESPSEAKDILQINAVKVFSSAVEQQTALYAQVGKAGAWVQVGWDTVDTAALNIRQQLCLFVNG